MPQNAGGEIALVPPFSESFQPGRAGAFSLFINETAHLSRYKGVLRVYGRPVGQSFEGIGFQPVEPKGPIWLSRNRRAAWRVGQMLADKPVALVEVFNRPEMFEVLGRLLPKTPIVLHLGNDPLEMRRAKSRRVRQRILDRAAGIWCCSRYICDRFTEGLTGPTDRVRALYSGAVRPDERPSKTPLILFVGRMIEEKGVLELADALSKVLPKHPDWRAGFVGANRPGGNAGLTPYELAVHERLKDVERQVTFHGFLPASEVADLMGQAAIVAVPSKWQEPMGRTAIEGLAAGCAVVAGRRGGLQEIVEVRGLALEEITAETLREAIEELISHPDKLQTLQDRAWADFPFELSDFVRRYDDWRAEAIGTAA